MIEQVLTNSTVTTTVLQSAGGLAASDWISLFSAVAMILLTGALVYYSYRTIDEGKKNRRKDTIEKMLENVYSPLYDILRRAQFADDRIKVRMADPAREFVLTEEELGEVHEIIERFGHYLGGQERMGLTNVLEKKVEVWVDQSLGRMTRPRYYRYRLVDLNDHWVFLWRTSDGLRRELEELTKRRIKGRYSFLPALRKA